MSLLAQLEEAIAARLRDDPDLAGIPILVENQGDLSAECDKRDASGLVYALVSIVRGFFLIPSTPFIFAGVLLFPTKPDWVLALSVLGVGSSATLVYFFSAHMGWDRFFRDKNPAQLAQLKARLESKYGLAFIALWSFFPAIPTDLICYVAGVVRIRYQYFIAALLLGELPLIAAYVYGGSSIFTYIEKLMASW